MYRPEAPGDPMEDVGKIIIAGLVVCGVIFIAIIIKIISEVL